MQPSNAAVRTFDDKPARRERVPLWVGLYGPSGGGKTFSALRLATGIQRVCGGEIFVIDTEARRALAYADRFAFRHLELGAPFSPLDYLAAVEHCVAKGARVIIVDSMSHEHEGPGGVLEWQAAEVERLCENQRRKGRDPNPDAYKMLAWQPPKSARRRMINTFLQLPVNFVFCFRAKDKTKPPPKGERDVIKLGFMPIAGEEHVYEMTATALLLPCADGVPTWHSNEIGEAMMIKRPEQFRPMLKEHAGKPLSEEIGEAMARWAAGDVESGDVARLSVALASAPDGAAIDALGREATALAKAGTITKADLGKLVGKAKERRAILASGAPSTAPEPRPTPKPEPAEREPGGEG